MFLSDGLRELSVKYKVYLRRSIVDSLENPISDRYMLLEPILQSREICKHHPTCNSRNLDRSISMSMPRVDKGSCL